MRPLLLLCAALALAYDPCDAPVVDPCPERCQTAADPEVCQAQCEQTREPGGGHTP